MSIDIRNQVKEINRKISSLGNYNQNIVQAINSLNDESFTVNLALGNIPGVMGYNIFGRNVNTNSAAYETVCDNSAVWVPPANAEKHSIVSTLAADALAGTGARTIRIYGVNGNWDLIQEDIEMNGVGAVNTVYSYVSIYKMKILTAGTGLINAGDITATAAISGTVTAKMLAGNGITQMSVFTVPRNKKALITYCSGGLDSIVSSATATFNLRTRVNADTATAAVYKRFSFTVAGFGASLFQQRFDIPIEIDEKSHITMEVITAIAAHSVTANFQLLLVDI